MSDSSKVSIRNFKNIDELYNYYSDMFDRNNCSIPCIDDNKSCDDFSNNSYMGGCLIFKRYFLILYVSRNYMTEKVICYNKDVLI